MKCFGFWGFDLEIGLATSGNSHSDDRARSRCDPIIVKQSKHPSNHGDAGNGTRRQCRVMFDVNYFPHPSHSIHVKVLHYDVSSTSSVCWQWGQLRNNSQHINTTVVETHPAIAHGIGSWVTSKCIRFFGQSTRRNHTTKTHNTYYTIWLYIWYIISIKFENVTTCRQESILPMARSCES